MIAIDFGLKRIGVAWKCGELILPLGAIKFQSDSQVAGDLSAILCEKKAKILVIGEVKEELSGALEAILALVAFEGDIKFVDENLSSAEAQTHINGRKKSKKLRKDGTLDSLSAMIILERYLAEKC
ncbi:Holliday junction resolvase RuvX [Helicobacter sp. 23-1044]